MKEEDRDVWSASTYVDELRRRRDEEKYRADRSDLIPSMVARERASVYEECAVLCQLTSDRRAWPAVFDAMRDVVLLARSAAAQHVDPRQFAMVVGALDRAMDARTTLPETVETDGHRGCRSERARCDEPRRGVKCGPSLYMRVYDPDADDPWDHDGKDTRPEGGTFR